MGTSKNIPSPDSPPWRPALTVIGRKGISAERQQQEIWRSAYAERGIRLTDDFGSTAVAAACEIAVTSRDVGSAARSFDKYVASERKAGLATEIAKRALIRAVSTNAGSLGFATELFAEATSYYASRDLPSYIGAKGRIDTVSAAIALKGSLKETTRSIVRAAGVPSHQPMAWAKYADSVIASLRGVSR